MDVHRCIFQAVNIFLSFVVGDWTNKTAKKILGLTKTRIKTNPLVITTDGLERYTELVPQFFPTSLYAQVIKEHKKHRLVGVKIKPINGSLEKIIQVIECMGLGKTVNTSYIERLNLTARNSVNSLARKTWCVFVGLSDVGRYVLENIRGGVAFSDIRVYRLRSLR